MVLWNVMQQTGLQFELISLTLSCRGVLNAKGHGIVHSRSEKFPDCSVVCSHDLFFLQDMCRDLFFFFFKLGFRARWARFLLLHLPSQCSFKIVVKIQDVLTNRLRTSSHKLVPKNKKTKQNKTNQKLKQNTRKENKGD